MSKEQNVVLNWMKRISKMLKLEQVLYHLSCTDSVTEEVRQAYAKLNEFEKYQVIHAFSLWGMEQA